MTLQETLRRARGDRPQADVAAAAGVKQSTVSTWESDDPEAHFLPAARRLPRVAAAYGIPLPRLRRLWLEASASRVAA